MPFKLEGITRVDGTPVHKALREALANCLVNADYYGRRGVVIIKRPKLITMANPGTMHIELDTAVSGGVSDPRNSALLKMFNFIDIGERAGSGIPITGMTEFIPTASNGTVEVTFVVDTYQLQGMEIVAFERLFAGSVMSSTLESDVPIAVHEDINDTDQTIKVPVIPFTPPHTGVDDHTGLLVTAMLTSGAGIAWILRKRKRH